MKVSSNPRNLQKTFLLASERAWVIVPVLGLLGALLCWPRPANADSGNSFFGTMGFGLAVGAVFGASTLPFYDQPGSHPMNIAYGAAAGLLCAVVCPTSGFESSDKGQEEAQLGLPQQRFAQFHENRSPRTFTLSQTVNSRLGGGRGRVLSSAGPVQIASLPPTLFWMPLVSLTW